MSNRNYNIYFSTHTVSGIIISVVLFIMFFAGSFAFFKDEIINWERGETVHNTKEIQLNYTKALQSIDKIYGLYGRNITISKPSVDQRLAINLEGSKDPLATNKQKFGDFFYLDTQNFETFSYQDSYSLGEFLYRLHFLAQVPYPYGYYLAGLVALFFLFAIITGLLLHWKKIVSNFYQFRPKEKIKTVWTDAHTGLGMIGLPFQFIYAVTGAFFMIKIVIVAPAVFVFFQGDEQKLYKALEYTDTNYDFKNQKLNKQIAIEPFIERAKQTCKNFEITRVYIQNYGDINMHVLIEGEVPYQEKFTGIGKQTFRVVDSKLISQKNPFTQSTYKDHVKNIMYRIHYGDYGGYILKIVSFLLGIISCFVIISGVMIWLVARQKNSIPEKKRKFNQWVVHVYLAICLSMYPTTALAFVMSKVCYPLNQNKIYALYFMSWLVLIIYFLIKRSDAYTTRMCLLLGSIIGFLIPISNGIITGNWLWISFANNKFQLFFIDIFWLIISSMSTFAYIKSKKTI